MTPHRLSPLFLALAALLSLALRLDANSAFWTAHQNDEVEWRHWNDAAIEEAKAEDKPLFFFSAHFGNSLARAMLSETFQNKTIAATLNESSIPVLVDVNEQPEFAAFLSLMAFQHFETTAWPTCLWTDTNLAPLNGGGYFPPTDDWGGQGFLSLARNVSEQWQARRDELLTQAQERLAKTTATSSKYPEDLASLQALLPTSAFEAGDAPSLPAVDLYLYSRALPNLPSDQAQALRTSIDSLIAKISSGAGFDLVSGGFFIGSNDPNWKLPLFQKATADQALMLATLAELHRQSPNPHYADLIRLTASFVERDLRKENGLALQYQDSFAVGESPDMIEGSYYLIDSTQLASIPADAVKPWGLSEKGNLDADTDILGIYEGQNVPFANDPAILTEQFDALRTALQKQRSAKPAPTSDKTGYTTTNALLVSSLAKASQATNTAAYLKQAEKSFASLLKNNAALPAGKLYNSDSQSSSATSSDYAYAAAAALDLFEITGSPNYLDTAKKIYSIWEADGRFLETDRLALPTGVETLSSTIFQDSSLPSATSVHLQNLQKFDAAGHQVNTPSFRAFLSNIPETAENHPELFRSLIAQSKLSQSGK